MPCDFLQLAVPGIRELSPYPPGKPIEELAREQGLAPEAIVKLASNENPLGPSQQAVKAATEAMSNLARYPDGNGFALKKALAEHLKVGINQLTLGNGSNELLVILAEAFLDKYASAVYSEYGFVVYSLAVKATGAEAIEVPAKDWGHNLPAIAEAIKDSTRVVFLANPNNPTGTQFDSAAFTAFMGKVPDSVMVVLDEAYIEYNEDKHRLNGVEWLKAYPNLVVCRTFSKAYGLAGARVGYAVSSPELAGVINRLRQAFNTNLLAQAAAVATLGDKDYLKKSIKCNTAGMKQMEIGLKQQNLEWIPSAGNFITVNVKQTASLIYEALLAKGVIVRPVANYGMPEHLRISIGLPEENQRCLDALAEVLGSNV